jgi:hypothetical protein
MSPSTSIFNIGFFLPESTLSSLASLSPSDEELSESCLALFLLDPSSSLEDEEEDYDFGFSSFIKIRLFSASDFKLIPKSSPTIIGLRSSSSD